MYRHRSSCRDQSEFAMSALRSVLWLGSAYTVDVANSNCSPDVVLDPISPHNNFCGMRDLQLFNP
ncbi:hypothetical protein MA16_Dca001585 [Dendrobium catenatum]|uniref:Uncharacterized protein n=1 Tax=Dendrobium catenatum TaxID=906689 RepID=A0A2I0WMU0_9ASPA|nr:hypothetical protein MA16_Dca001585 [Dendrobium catenatum]